MNDTCICDNVPKVWRLTGVTRTLRLRIFNPDGTPLDLTGREVAVTIARDNSEFVYAPGFVIEGDDGNVVKFEWPADQQGAGDYTINVTTTDGSGNIDRVNWHGPTGIRLVDFSFMVRGEDALGVTSEANIGLDGTFTANGAGMSAYDEWLVEGHTGTPEDFIAWLRQPATDAASAAEAQMGQIQSRADEDHRVAGSDHNRAAEDHTTATDDHRIAAADHSTATGDHTLAVSDHGTAAEDHRVAGIDHGTAAADHTQATADHTTAASDHQQAQSDHSTASADHMQAVQDAEQAASDHTRAGNDHDTAVADHQQAEADHTRAEADHTTAAADHTTAAADHTQATADHAVMAGYDTRLGNVEGEVSQLGQKVEKVQIPILYEDGYVKLNEAIGTTITISKTSNASFKSYMISCSPGDKVIITGTGGGAPRLYGFLDSNNVLLEVAPQKTSYTNKVVTAPSGSASVIINDSSSSVSYLIKNGSLYQRVFSLEDNEQQIVTSVERLENNVFDSPQNRNIYNESYIIEGYYFKDSTLVQGSVVTFLADSGCSYIRIPVKPSTDYAISAKTWAGIPTRLLVDSDNRILNPSPKSDRFENGVISGHQDAKYLLIQIKYNNQVCEDVQVEEGSDYSPYIAPKFGIAPTLLPDTREPFAEIPNSKALISQGLNRFCFKLSKNYCNTSGSDMLLKIYGNIQLTMYIDYSPASADLFYQKENQSREDDIYQLELPMANMQTILRLTSDSDIASITLNGSAYRSIVRQTPPIIIRYITSEPSSHTGIRIYTETTNGVVSRIFIKDGDTQIYTRSIDSTMRVCEFYPLLKADLEALDGYDFELTFSNVENLTMADMVAIKSSGLPFVTGFSSNSKDDGTIIYDTYPVILDFQDDRVYNLDIAYDGNKLRIYVDNTYFVGSEISDINVYEIEFGEGVSVLRSGYFNRKTLNGKSLIHGYTGHSLWNDTSERAAGSLHIPVGSISVIATKAKNQGFANISIEELGMKFIKNEELPERCYFIELDDFASLDGFQKMLSPTDEDGLRIMEILKMHGIKMGFAQEFHYETALYNAILNGTATEEQKATLSTRFTNDKVLKMRAMMASYGWTVSIHTLIDSVNPTTARFSDFVSAVRKTIGCYERMYLRSPMAYVTSGTGNSSPYYRRMFPMFGIPIVIQDDATIYSDGYEIPFVARDYIYQRTNVQDIDQGITTKREN